MFARYCELRGAVSSSHKVNTSSHSLHHWYVCAYVCVGACVYILYIMRDKEDIYKSIFFFYFVKRTITDSMGHCHITLKGSILFSLKLKYEFQKQELWKNI